MRKSGMILLCILLLSGCSNAGNNQKQKIAEQGNKKPVIVKAKEEHVFRPLETSQAERIGQTVKGVDETAAVVMDKDISIGVKVTGFNRFYLKSIKKSVGKQIKSQFPKTYKVHVTTDKKLFRQLKDLKASAEKRKTKEQKLWKQFNEINKNMHG